VTRDPVTAHVAAFERVLLGPARARRSMIDEVRDGLRDAEAAYRECGFDPHRAAAQAVRDFGAVHEIAPLMQAELTARQGRRIAVLVAVAFPLLISGWDLLCAALEPWGVGAIPSVVRALITVQEIAISGIAAVASGLLLATFRRAVSPRRITAAAALLGTAAVAVCGVTGISMTAINAVRGENVIVLNPVGLPVLTASLVFLGIVVRTAARSLRVARCPG
jgi:hypothetical protein